MPGYPPPTQPVAGASPTAPPAAVETRPIDLLLARTWPRLETAVAALQQQGGDAASALASSPLPGPGPQLANSLLSFFALLGGGDPRSWLGTVAGQLAAPAGRPELTGDLARDLGQFVRISAEPEPGQWRAFLFPLFDGSALHQIRFFTRSQPGSGEDPDEGAGTRFVVDVELSRLGTIQLDGLVTLARFELVVRSHTALPESARSHIQAVFEEANDIGGAAGALRFQAVQRFPVDPLAERLSGDRDAMLA